MKKSLALLLMVTLMMFFIGCASARYWQIPKLNIVGKSIEGSTFSISDYEMVESSLEGKDSFSIIIFIPIMGKNQDLLWGMIDNAVQKICEKNNYDFMTNVKIYHSGWYVPLIVGKQTITVVGEGWTKKGKAELKEELKQLSLSFDENGEVYNEDRY